MCRFSQLGLLQELFTRKVGAEWRVGQRGVLLGAVDVTVADQASVAVFILVLAQIEAQAFDIGLFQARRSTIRRGLDFNNFVVSCCRDLERELDELVQNVPFLNQKSSIHLNSY